MSLRVGKQANQGRGVLAGLRCDDWEKPEAGCSTVVEMANWRVLLPVGTHKGGFLLSSVPARQEWKVEGPFFKGNDVNHLVLDQRTGTTLLPV